MTVTDGFKFGFGFAFGVVAFIIVGGVASLIGLAALWIMFS